MFYTFKNIPPTLYTYKNTVLPEISSNGAGKNTWLKLRTKFC